MLLDRIPRRKQHWHDEFMEALRTCNLDFVAENIEMAKLNIKPTINDTRQKTATEEELTELENDGYITAKFIPGLDSPKRATSRNLNAESEIAQLAIQKTKLTRQLEELREKHKIKREIKRLEKEIQELLSAESECERPIQETESEPARTFHEVDVTDASSQTDETEQKTHWASKKAISSQGNEKMVSVPVPTGLNTSEEKMTVKMDDKVNGSILRELITVTNMLANELQTFKQEQIKPQWKTVQPSEWCLSLPIARLPNQHIPKQQCKMRRIPEFPDSGLSSGTSACDSLQ